MAKYTQIVLRRDSTLNWYASNPRLALGEPGVDMDLHRFKIGNGIDRWNELPYMDDDLYKLLDKTQQEIADNVQALLNKINTNKTESDQHFNSLETEVRNTSRDLKSRMSAVETEQDRYEKDLTQKVESRISSVEDEQIEYETKLTREITGRMSAVESEQGKYEKRLTGQYEGFADEVSNTLAEYKTTTDNLDKRMDVIVGSATEDTEILDARIDAEGIIHPNVAHNIKSIHSKLLKYEEAETAERIAGDEKLQGQINEVVGNLQNQDSRITSNSAKIDNLYTDIAATREEIEASHNHLQEQSDMVSDLVLSEAYRTREKEKAVNQDIAGLEQECKYLHGETDKLTEGLNHEVQRLDISGSHLQEQIDDLAESSQITSTGLYEEILERRQAVSEEVQAREQAIAQEAQAREESDTHLQSVITERGEFLQEQADILADLAVSQAIRHIEDIANVKEIITQETRAIQTDLTHEQDSRVERDEYLQEQINEVSEGIIRNAKSISLETQSRREAATQLEGTQTEQNEYLQEQTNDLASGLVNLIKEVYRQHSQNKETLQRELAHRDEELDRLRDMIQDLTDAALSLVNTVNYSRENQSSNKSTEQLAARLTVIENALVEGGLLVPSEAPPKSESEIDEILDGIFTGNSTTEPEEPDETDDDKEFYDALDQELGLNP